MLAVVLIVVAALAVVAIALGAVGRETGLLAARARPAVFDLEEAVDFIADRLPDAVAGHLTHDDVRWVLRRDAELLERATAELAVKGVSGWWARRRERGAAVGPEIVDEDLAVARILQRVAGERPDLADEDVVAVLDGRLDYLRAIGAIGPQVADPKISKRCV
ncbi:MAG: hypothetical protein HYX34_15170 [Actinobacteria bacterium]|nr:hypothetical protein [Actinomycetota bacterium]